MVEIICSGIAFITFVAFMFISCFGRNNRKWSIVKNICLVLLAFMHSILLWYTTNLGGAVGNLIAMYMALWLLV